MSQNPEVFGMDDNVDISKELQETRQVFDSILLTQTQHSGGSSGKRTEDALNEIATDILSKAWAASAVHGYVLCTYMGRAGQSDTSD